MKPTMAFLAVLTLASCAGNSEYVWVDDLDDKELATPAYVIRPGDRIAVAVWNQQAMSGEARVRADGKATVPLIGDVAVGGATTPTAAERIAKLLGGLVIDPKVTVAVVEPRAPMVTVVGEVRQPGNFPVLGGECVLDIIAKAGGITEFADEDEVFVIRHGPNALRVRFDYDRLMKGVGRGLRFPLRDGDIVVVR